MMGAQVGGSGEGEWVGVNRKTGGCFFFFFFFGGGGGGGGKDLGFPGLKMAAHFKIARLYNIMW